METPPGYFSREMAAGAASFSISSFSCVDQTLSTISLWGGLFIRNRSFLSVNKPRQCQTNCHRILTRMRIKSCPSFTLASREGSPFGFAADTSALHVVSLLKHTCSVIACEIVHVIWAKRRVGAGRSGRWDNGATRSVRFVSLFHFASVCDGNAHQHAESARV